MTFSSCHFAHDNILRAQFLQPQKRLRFIVLLRDPADWLWAAWNFYHDQALDALAPSHQHKKNWADASRHYRSPELFHDILVAGERLTSWHRLSLFRTWSVTFPRMLIAAFGRENVLLARNEDMLPSYILKDGGFLDRLSYFTGLSRSGFDLKKTQLIHNCNDHKGNTVTCGKTIDSAYAIAGNRSMLPESRKLAYLHFAVECKIWMEEFGIEYHECLNV